MIQPTNNSSNQWFNPKDTQINKQPNNQLTINFHKPIDHKQNQQKTTNKWFNQPIIQPMIQPTNDSTNQ